MVQAIGSRWKTEIQDFTPTNQSGIFRHRYSVTFEVENDEGEMISKRRQVTYLYATIPGQGRIFIEARAILSSMASGVQGWTKSVGS
jgi:hypothetical protein